MLVLLQLFIKIVKRLEKAYKIAKKDVKAVYDGYPEEVWWSKLY